MHRGAPQDDDRNGDGRCAKAPMRPDDPARLVAELAIFGAACAALAAADRPRLAFVFGAVVAVHLALTFPLAQR
jgi:hypothetical protein